MADPPTTPNRKTNRTNPNGERDEGQEFGLVPKHLWRKMKLNSSEKDSSASVSISLRGNETSSTDTETAATAPTPTASPTRMKDSSSSASRSSSGGEVIARSLDEVEHLVKAPEQVAKLLEETNALLAKRWSVPRLEDEEKQRLLEMENYNPEQAANRIEGQWKTKVDLFGKEAADKEVALSDLTKTSKTDVGVEDGLVQLIPTRDLAGRAILFFQFDAALYKKQSKPLRKILYYMMQTALEDAETRSKGLVLVVWNENPPENSGFLQEQQAGGLLSSLFDALLDPFWNAWNNEFRLPFRVDKLHYCQRTSQESASPYTVQEKNRESNTFTDIRIHRGSLHECLHGLVTYGIPSHFLPFQQKHEEKFRSTTTSSTTPSSLIDVTRHWKWIDLRRRMEILSSSTQKGDHGTLVLVPSRGDVLLLGKQQHHQQQQQQQVVLSKEGNAYFHQLVFRNVEAYYENNSARKEEIIRNVWDLVTTSRHGRFLQQVEEGQLWEELDLESAAEKIRQAFDYVVSQHYAPKLNAEIVTTPSEDSRRKTRSMYDPMDLNEIFLGTEKCWNLVHACKDAASTRTPNKFW